MKTILIIGLGNIGLRHAESIIKKNRFKLDILDIRKNKINSFKKKILRFKKNNLNFYDNINKINSTYDLVIIATNSLNRDILISKIIKKTKFSKLITEKIVFQNISLYQKYISLFKKLKIKCWVNCSNRFMPSFIKLKKYFNKNDPITMFVYGDKWNMASNFVHYVDLFSFFINDTNIKVQTLNLSKKIIKSKHKDCYEFTGNVSLISRNKSSLILERTNDNLDHIIKIYSKNFYFELNKNNKNAYIKTPNKELKKINFNIPLQSEMTNNLCVSLLKDNKEPLSNLNNHFCMNKDLFEKIKNHYKLIKTNKSKFVDLPIT